MKIEQSALVNLFDSLILHDETKEEILMKSNVEIIKNPTETIVEPKIENIVQTKVAPKETEPTIVSIDASKEKAKIPLEIGLTLVFEQSPSEAEEELLQKILSNIKLNNNQIERIIDKDFKLNENIRFNHLLSWGIPFEGHSKYDPKLNNGVTILVSDSLKDISNQTELKLKLWNCLKALFLKN